VIKFPADAFMRPNIYSKLEDKKFAEAISQLFTRNNQSPPPDEFFKVSYTVTKWFYDSPCYIIVERIYKYIFIYRLSEMFLLV